ncbi:unnamed protein product [Orchesella dallaii]|uniref:Uncharacterized protein n=1 Tax=Orchesella dallaii TaxID=48710 RepID=A0ABP1QXQ4_9HEXA
MRYGAVYSSGIGAMWLECAEWVLKVSDEKAFHIMKEMFPDVRKLDITGNIAVIFYTFMIFQALAFAIFAIENLWARIASSVKPMVVSGSGVANPDPNSQFPIASQATREAFLVNTNGPTIDKPTAGRKVYEIKQKQVSVMDKKGRVVGFRMSIMGEGDLHINSLAEVQGYGAAAKDEQLLSDEHLMSAQDGNFQNNCGYNSLATLRQTQVNCDESSDNDSNISDK